MLNIFKLVNPQYTLFCGVYKLNSGSETRLYYTSQFARISFRCQVVDCCGAFRVISSSVERCPDKTEVHGSTP